MEQTVYWFFGPRVLSSSRSEKSQGFGYPPQVTLPLHLQKAPPPEHWLSVHFTSVFPSGHVWHRPVPLNDSYSCAILSALIDHGCGESNWLLVVMNSTGHSDSNSRWWWRWWGWFDNDNEGENDEDDDEGDDSNNNYDNNDDDRD